METLKDLLEKFKASVHINAQFEDVAIHTNPDADNREEIIPGDDTLIFLGGNGKFVFEDMNKGGSPSFEATADEMVDYYEGVVEAYGIDLKEDKSCFYKNGFVVTTQSLLNTYKHKK